MLICIGGLLSPERLARARELLHGQTFVPGERTAGWAARLVKNNEQLDPQSKSHPRLQTLITEALQAHEVFMAAAMPKAMRPVMLSRYGVGMSYGSHVDNAIMGEAPRIRTDLAFTLFLAEPTEYEGGELVVDEVEGEQRIKLPAGALVLYSATRLHRVETVTAGERLVGVGWLQSLVRSAEQRQLLFELESLRREVFRKDGKSPAFDALSKAAANLLRMWAEP